MMESFPGDLPDPGKFPSGMHIDKFWNSMKDDTTTYHSKYVKMKNFYKIIRLIHN